MSLIKSISGIRGTIGGKPGTALTPIDIVKFTTAYGLWVLKEKPGKGTTTIVVGRDARISGTMVNNLVVSTLQALGLHVLDIGLSATPTVEMAVKFENAAGGIILTASHNPKEWNALKLLNSDGEFISDADGKWILEAAEKGDASYAEINKLGVITASSDHLDKHIQAILSHPFVDVAAITEKNFKVVVDPVNSSGAIAVPQLLAALGVTEYTIINEQPNGQFAHNPEPLPENLQELSSAVKKQNAHLGIAVDPDVDRLAFICEDGAPFGEEYTLVAVADYVLSRKKGNTVSNLSSTRALKDVTLKHGGEYNPSAVGEVNVVRKMKETNAVIGGEGNGGIIVPDLHYGRDALIGIALFLTHLARTGKSISALRKSYPDYYVSKNKIGMPENKDIKLLFQKIEEKYFKQKINREDGLRIDFEQDWVHLRTSNTEPIIRIYAESTSQTLADNIAKRIMGDIKELINQS